MITPWQLGAYGIVCVCASWYYQGVVSDLRTCTGMIVGAMCIIASFFLKEMRRGK